LESCFLRGFRGRTKIESEVEGCFLRGFRGRTKIESEVEGEKGSGGTVSLW